MIRERVKQYYRQDNFNCAITTLKILGEKFAVPINDQVLDAAVGMHGAGGSRAQCGLVEGTLLFLGIWGRKNSLSDEDIIDACREFATTFTARFGSLLCKELRPEGFSPDNPPHLCEPLTCATIIFSIEFITECSKKYGLPTNTT